MVPSWVKPASHLALAALAARPLEGSQLPQLPPPLLLRLSTTGNVNESRELDTSHYNLDKISSRSSETLKQPEKNPSRGEGTLQAHLRYFLEEDSAFHKSGHKVSRFVAIWILSGASWVAVWRC